MLQKNIGLQIKILAKQYEKKLSRQIKNREQEMRYDDHAHYLIYKILKISQKEGRQIDLYQNRGRFVYRYAGLFLEDAARLCFRYKYREVKKAIIKNVVGQLPKKFEIDCLVGTDAHEIKWRDATTDGDHVAKEIARIKSIKYAGFTPIRIMFYHPQRLQAQKVQQAIAKYYVKLGGKYFSGPSAWQYIKRYTKVDLLKILREIARQR